MAFNADDDVLDRSSGGATRCRRHIRDRSHVVPLARFSASIAQLHPELAEHILSGTVGAVPQKQTIGESSWPVAIVVEPHPLPRRRAQRQRAGDHIVNVSTTCSRTGPPPRKRLATGVSVVEIGSRHMAGQAGCKPCADRAGRS
jgi:hypothetical protein